MKNTEDDIIQVDYMEKMPSWFILWGNTVFALFFILLITGLHLISFNSMVSTDVELLNVTANKTMFEGIIKIPFKERNKIKINQKVILKLDDFPYEKYGFINGKVTNVTSTDIDKNEVTYIGSITMDSMITNRKIKINPQNKMTGSVEVIVKELSLLQRLFIAFED